jgi:hypothetical protein
MTEDARSAIVAHLIAAHAEIARLREALKAAEEGFRECAANPHNDEFYREAMMHAADRLAVFVIYPVAEPSHDIPHSSEEAYHVYEQQRLHPNGLG